MARAHSSAALQLMGQLMGQLWRTPRSRPNCAPAQIIADDKILPCMALALGGKIGPSGRMAIGDKMGRHTAFLWAFPLLIVLAGCVAKPGGGAQPTDVRPLDMSAISAQTLAPVTLAAPVTLVPSNLTPAPLGSAPTAGRVIGAASTSALTSGQPALGTSAAESPADIGAAATSALRAGGGQILATSPEEASCIAEGGRWGKAGTSSAMACFRPANDAGKTCTAQSDCTTQCLARSGSCAPFWPIFGCTEVIQNDGSVVQLCLE